MDKTKKSRLAHEYYLKNKERIAQYRENGQVRNLLCKKCNSGLGSFSDNIYIMTLAINYVADWKGVREKCQES